LSATAGPATASAGVGLRSERGPVLGAIMLTTALIALDSTVIATAVPSVVEDLGGFSQFPWLFSVYLLTQAVTVPVYGKLADVVGRKPVMVFGIVVFVLASVLCGLAWSMPALIVARGLQGIGAGAVQPMGITIIGDLYSVEERSRVQGYVASVWGAASVLGPALGGLFSEYVSWRWIFFINVPLGAIALFVLHRRFSEQVQPRVRRPVDYAGTALLTLGCSLLILGLLEGGNAWGWRSVTSAVVLGGSVLALAAFVAVERRAADPVLPLWVFRRRVLVGGNLTALGVGVLLIGLSSYVPTYVQGVLGTGAVEAGFALGALTIGWPIAAACAGRIYLRIGFRDTALIGSAFVVGGSLLTVLLLEDSPVWAVAGAMFVTGLGMGLVSSPTVVAVQSVVDWQRRGVVTGTNMFCRAMGSAVGAALTGAVANATLADRFSSPPAAVAGQLPGDVDSASLALTSADPGVVTFVRGALFDASHHVFLGLLVVAVLLAGAVALMPRRTSPLVLDEVPAPAGA
jgi:EmrB/QacA subfamily drug resistance transporter